MVEWACKICGKTQNWGRGNAYYCHECRAILLEKGAYRYHIGKGKTYVWVKNGRILRATQDGKEVSAVRELYEVMEWNI